MLESLLLGLFLSLLPGLPLPPAQADVRWGWDAHKMICQMTYWQLNEDTRNTVNELISRDPEYDRFAESCLWADRVRGEDEAFDRFKTAHYVNLPRDAGEFVLERDCADTYCVVEAIRDQRRILSDPDSPTEDRLVALKFVAHFVSDIHQPLHAGYGDDRGGNDTPVTVFGEETNLHATWDYRLVEHTGLSWVDYASVLYFDLLGRDVSEWQSQLDAGIWAEESFSVISGSAYDIPADGEIGQLYYEKHIGTLERRMQQASVRLAAILNRSLSN